MKCLQRTALPFRTFVAMGMVAAVGVAAVFTLTGERLRISQVDTPAGTIIVEIADTPAARAAGLSNRDTLSDIDGLLLKWDEAARHPIWMAGMRFSLDLVWIDREGRVLSVLSNVPPCRVEPCTLYEPEGTADSVAVLELPAGAAAKCQLTAGTTVRVAAAQQLP
jgi:uncharacterized membrane protein (UPF0127 family)